MNSNSLPIVWEEWCVLERRWQQWCTEGLQICNQLLVLPQSEKRSFGEVQRRLGTELTRIVQHLRQLVDKMWLLLGESTSTSTTTVTNIQRDHLWRTRQNVLYERVQEYHKETQLKQRLAHYILQQQEEQNAVNRDKCTLVLTAWLYSPFLTENKR